MPNWIPAYAGMTNKKADDFSSALDFKILSFGRYSMAS